MSLTNHWTKNLYDYINYQLSRPRPLELGSGSGEAGGGGAPAAGIFGQLSQRYVAYDTSEAATSACTSSAGSSPSLLNNLNRIRGGHALGDDAILDRHVRWATTSGVGTSGCISPREIPYFTSGCMTADNVHDALLEAYLSMGVVAPLDLELPTSETATIQDVITASHITSGTAAALFGVRQKFELEDAGGTKQAASEVVTMWSDPTAGAESPLLRMTTYPEGNVGPGYMGFWTWDDLDGTARVVIPNGSGDVVSSVHFLLLVQPSTGSKAAGTATVEVDSSAYIYSDDPDYVTFAVDASGEATVQRTGGSLTYDVVLLMIWI